MDYGAAVCMRGDLGKNGKAGGCYDTKVTSAVTGAHDLAADIVSGPTSRASSTTSLLTPFQWRQQDGSHIGLPFVFDFPFVRVQPEVLP